MDNDLKSAIVTKFGTKFLENIRLEALRFYTCCLKMINESYKEDEVQSKAAMGTKIMLIKKMEFLSSPVRFFA